MQIYALGRFEVRVDGTPLPKKRKAPHRLLELLQAIVARGGCAVPVSQLIDQLWPQSEGDRGYATFVKSLKRLRKYLVIDGLVILEHGTVTLNPERCWVDVWEFEQQYRRSERNPRRENSCSWPSGYERAIELYGGPFLPAQGEKPWVVSTRERLREMYVRAVARLSDHCQREGRIEQAIAWLDNGLRLDPQAEPLSRTLVALLREAGLQIEARAICYRYMRVLPRKAPDSSRRP